MTPAASSRCRRSATAGGDKLTCRASQATVRRASLWSSLSRRRLMSSMRSPFALRFEGITGNLSGFWPVPRRRPSPSCGMGRIRQLPPHVYFVISAVFHYLGPSFAVLLFARVPVLGVAWLRIASAAVIFAVWRRPWRWLTCSVLIGWGATLAAMNCCFYEAIHRLPLGTVAAIEFLPVIALAALGARLARNLGALALAVSGVALLSDVSLSGQPLGFAFALANAALFALYLVLAHRAAR